MFDELIKRLDREYLASGRKDHFFHIFTTNAETSSAYTGDDLIFGVVCRPTGHAQLAEVLNARYLVPSRAVVFGYLRFNGRFEFSKTLCRCLRGLVYSFKGRIMNEPNALISPAVWLNAS